MMDSVPAYHEDEIDLRRVARSLLRYKWLILALPLLLAAATWLYIQYYIPRPYQATAVLVITKPALVASFDPRLTTTIQAPDAQTLTYLATTEEVIERIPPTIIANPAMQALPQDGFTPAGLRSRMSVSLVSAGQIRLTFTDSDPQRAASIVNVWAELVTARLNDFYGASETSLKQVEGQIRVARQQWAEREAELLAILPQNGFDALEVRLEQARDQLKVYLNRQRDIELIAADATSLEKRLADQDQAAPLRLEDKLSLITLHQRLASGVESDFQIQMTNLEALAGDGTVGNDTVAEARLNLQAFIRSLQAQSEELQAALERVNAEVARLATDKEAASHEKSVLTVQRDLAQASFEALSSRAEEVRIALSQNDQAVKIAELAHPPSEPLEPPSLSYTLAAAAAGLMLAVFLALLIEWWRGPQRSAAVQPAVRPNP